MNNVTKKDQHSEIQQLIEDLSKSDKSAREEARKSLALLGEPVLKPLSEALIYKNRSVRYEITRTLTAIHLPETAPILVKELEDEDPDIRWLASKGLISLGRKGLLPLLNSLINKPDSLWLRMGAHHILADLIVGEVHENEDAFLTIYGLSQKSREVLKPVLVAMESMDHNVFLPGAAGKAVDALRNSGDI